MLDEEMVRRERLALLKNQGVDPYPSTTTRTHALADVQKTFDALLQSSEMVTVVGRVRLIRKHGGLSFLQLQDESGFMQIALKRDEVGEDVYNFFHNTIDIGDFLEIIGHVFVTKKGEQTILATSYRLLAKTLSPLPEKWHGLTDVEQRYRARELDLLSHSDVKDRFIKRSKLVMAIRNFLNERGFIEVETPILQPIPGGANARPFVTHHNALDVDLYLRIAPELYLKRLLVGGFEKIYEIGRVFRNEGIDYAHNPEFTMLELYWAFTSNRDSFIDFLETLLRTVTQETIGTLTVSNNGSEFDFSVTWPRKTFREVILEACQIDIDMYKEEQRLIQAVKDNKLDIDFKDCVGIGECYDQLYKKTAREKLIQPIWIFDYPIELKPLAKASPEDPTKSASVQLIMNGMEIMNVYYHELNDAIDQRERFETQEKLRERGSEEAQYVDEEFLSALEHGMPPASGMGLGIDRFIAFITDAPNLKEVILFPTLRPKTHIQTQTEQKKIEDVFGEIKSRLEKKNIKFETKSHGPKSVDSDEAMGFDPNKSPHHEGAKAIIVKGKKTGNFHLFVIPDDCKLDQKKAALVVNEKFSFASPTEVEQVTGCVPGSVPPFGSIFGLTTHTDQQIKDNSVIFFNAGTLTNSIKLSSEDYLQAEPSESVDVSIV